MTLEVEGVCPLLMVFDMPTSITFYRDTLGFHIVETSDPGDEFDWAWLRLDEADIMLKVRLEADWRHTMYEAHERPPAADPTRTDAHRDTELYFGCRDVDAAYTFLRDQGLPVDKPVVRSYGMKQLYVRDPDGYTLCFQWRAG